VAAVPYANTPFVLTLHWHGFVETRLADVSDANVVAYQPVPSSALQVNDAGTASRSWSTRFSTWRGAGLVGPRAPGGAAVHPAGVPSAQESLEAWAPSATFPSHRGAAAIVAEVPDSEELIDAAGRSGYVQWMFRPVRGGVWAEVADDATLETGGYRNPPCPHLAQPTKPGTSRRVVYQFGRSDRLVT